MNRGTKKMKGKALPCSAFYCAHTSSTASRSIHIHFFSGSWGKCEAYPAARTSWGDSISLERPCWDLALLARKNKNK